MSAPSINRQRRFLQEGAAASLAEGSAPYEALEKAARHLPGDCRPH